MHFGRAHERIVAVADIGSGSAGVAILAIGDTHCRILVSERRSLSLEERVPEATVAAIGKHLVEAGKSALEKHRARKGAMPKAVYAVIRSPWTRSKTLRAHVSFEESRRISGALIAQLAQQALGEDAEFDKSQILEAGVVRVELNGYPTNKPEGKPAVELSVAVLVSICDPVVRSTVTSALAELFGAVTPVMRSGVHALLAVLKERGGNKDYLVVDMASEGTNLIVIRNGVATDHAFVAEGKRSLLKRIGSFGAPDEVLTLLHMRNRGECSDTVCKDLDDAVAKAEPELVRLFGEAMSKLVAEERLPNDLILASHGDMMTLLGALFTRIDFTQFTATTQPFSVDALEPEDFAHWVLPESGIKADTGISIAATLVNIEESRR